MNNGQKLSVAGAVLGSAAWGALLVILGIVIVPMALRYDVLDNQLAVVGGCLFWGGPVSALAGLGLGIAGLVTGNPHRPSAAAGIVLPGGALLGSLVLFSVAAYVVLTLLSGQS